MDCVPASPIERLAALLDYPYALFPRAIAECGAALAGQLPDAARELARFATAVEGLSIQQLQELYVDTFDFDPRCTLDLGWHLHGEEYARGAFLASMREKLQRAGMLEAGELPDHLPLLAVLASRLDRPEADELRAMLRPAVEMLDTALDARRSPYVHLLRSLVAAVSLGG